MSHVGRPASLALLLPLFALILASCQTIGSGAAQAQPSAPNGTVTSLAIARVDGSLLEVAGGLWRSTDQSQSWHALAIPTSLHPEKLRQVATLPAAPTSIFAAGPGAGVLRSDDDGKTWRRISAGLPSQQVTAFAVHSYLPDTIYSWIAGQGVFRTENGGQRWQKMDSGPDAAVVALAHSTLEGSMNTGWLYAATPKGPYLSMDCF